MIDRLIKDDILSLLDFQDLGTFIDCIRGKLIKTKKYRTTKSQEFLNIIHIDINGPYLYIFLSPLLIIIRNMSMFF